MANANTTPSMSSRTPLQLSGFLTGDTIRLRGDTGELQFSVKLNIAKKLFTENPDPLDTITHSPDDFSGEGSGFSPPPPVEALGGRALTRLQSGVLSRSEYFPRVPRWRAVIGAPRRRKRRAAERDVFERLMWRRSFPVRPCSPYAFFVMGNWSDVSGEGSSFGETSKRVAMMWCQLRQEERKVYEEMASKDNARYKWQSELFMSRAD